MYWLILADSSTPSVIIMSGQLVEIGGIRVDISQFDFSDTSSKVNDVRTANIVLISLVLLTVTLRLVARTRFVRRIFADDGESLSIVPRIRWHRKVFIVIAAVFTLALAATCIAGTFFQFRRQAESLYMR
jgi:hypothetical protein